MNTPLKKIVPDELPWITSPTGAPGYCGKKIFNYSTRGLVRDGAAGSYTTLYRFAPSASYPPFRMTEGVCELGVLHGALKINGEKDLLLARGFNFHRKERVGRSTPTLEMRFLV